MSTHEQQVDRGSFDRGALFVQSVSISRSLFTWKHDRGNIVCKSVSRTRRGSTHDSLHLQNESNGLIPCDCDMQDFELPRRRHHIIARQSSLRDALLQKGISRLHWRHRRHGVIEHPNVWRHLRRFLCFRLATHIIRQTCLDSASSVPTRHISLESYGHEDFNDMLSLSLN
jgi:hypothetical protein